ncbi:hypothetical protein [Halomonas sp. 707B3]|jgi:hypothetical protein|uniref:hypothetical protein n=1 Tax=Halomonas sp. 707B3 TaxID=1681043 RepID=UPI0020A2067B|nr:hypothetical protein [Halomonas sp. 707B3]MCP1316881.1 hypothetical protein [Halomonas sp. 707B3]
MINRAATHHVNKVACEDFDTNKHLIGPLIAYTHETFSDPEHRARFIAMVAISMMMAGGDADSAAEVMPLFKDALLDVIERIAEQEPAPTVH